MIDRNALLSKIGHLKAKFKDPQYPDDLAKIENWDNEARDLINREEVGQNPYIKLITQRFKESYEGLNSELIVDNFGEVKCETCLKRKLLVEKRRILLDFIELFDVEGELERIAQEVDKEIKHALQQNY